MNTTEPEDAADSRDLSELKMAIMYGTEGLKRSTETEEYDEWLNLFDDVLEQLESPRKKGRRNFPLKEAAFPHEVRRRRIVTDLKSLREIAEDVESMDIDERQNEKDTISEAIKMGNELYDILEAPDEDGEKILKAD